MTHLADPLAAAAVADGRRLIDVYERLGGAASAAAFADDLERRAARAQAELVDIEPWDGAEEAQFVAYRKEPNRSRFRRMIDFVPPGTSVFEIGCGPGFTAVLLARHTALARYRGVDLGPKKIAAFQRALDALALDPAVFSCEQGDLYALLPEDMAGADLLLCCEVLEHLPDPDKALSHIAESMPENADLLFTVPLYGRLEAVWGHRSVFDLARLDEMCAAAGLTVHHIEPLSNTWTLIAASRSPRTSDRVAAARTAPDIAPQHVGRYEFVDLAPTSFDTLAGTATSSSLVVEAGAAGVRCTAVALQRRVDEHVGGVGFDVPALLALRLAITGLEVEGLERFDVDLCGGGEVVGRWAWNPSKRWRAGGHSQRLALRARESSGMLRETVPLREGPVDRVELRAVLAAGGRVDFKVRAGFLPGSPFPGR
ncbi:MAG: class I SAM-dependent methyltransferase [Sporichthyaceae bacterium]